MIRELLFLKPVCVSVISQRRKNGPPGLHGGGDGKSGSQRLILGNGEVVPLQGCDVRQVEAGTSLVIETPGGGGWNS